MKKLTAIYLSIISLLFVNATQAQLQDILEEHFDAVGQKKLNKTESMYTTGKIVQMGFEIPMSLTLARPNKVRMEGTFQGQTFVQVYNGTEGWSINPFAGSLDPQPMGADELISMKTQADMDGMLWDWEI
ncbi:MAG: hypothetical protein H7Y00_07180, partial [Fimbriimonadaceae bacterium]|nr:hypothetical protein [Chitinophagales bacterium]